MDKQLTSTTPGMATIGTSPAAVTARPRVASLGHIHVPLAPEKSALAPPVGDSHTLRYWCVCSGCQLHPALVLTEQSVPSPLARPPAELSIQGWVEGSGYG